MPRVNPADYGLTEQEIAELARDLEDRSGRIGFRAAMGLVALFCLLLVVTEGVLVGFLVAISTGLFVLLFGSILVSGLAERWIIATDTRMARYQSYRSESERRRPRGRQRTVGNGLPKNIERIVDGEASPSESRRTISKYLGQNDW